jgi:hypothetical protein
LLRSFFVTLLFFVELAAVSAFKDPSKLDQASRVVFQFNRIPNLLRRMECHEVVFRWASDANAVASQLGVLKCAHAELIRSEDSLKSMFALLLAVGNYLNGDSTRGQVYIQSNSLFVVLVAAY